MVINTDLKLYFQNEWKTLSILGKLTFNYLPIKLFIRDFEIPKKLDSDMIFFQSMERSDYDSFSEKIFSSIKLENKQFFKSQKRSMFSRVVNKISRLIFKKNI